MHTASFAPYYPGASLTGQREFTFNDPSKMAIPFESHYTPVTNNDYDILPLPDEEETVGILPLPDARETHSTRVHLAHYIPNADSDNSDNSADILSDSIDDATA
ncbi:hypothetical protein E8E11_010613 [Didymella keratinophila]|nr:hypothetical protein E8E11_010613 [Didymella keratinophila]